jgi:hypothetical protein
MAQNANSPETRAKEGTVQQQTPFTRLIRQLSLEAEIDAADNSGNASTIATIDRIMSAENDEDIWNAGDLANIGGRNLVDVEMQVTDFLVKYGNRDDVESVFMADGRKFFLLIKSTIIGIPSTDAQEFNRPPLEIGQEIVWNTSAPDIVPKLVAFRDRNKFPLDCVIRALDLGGGKHYLRLKPVPKRAVR